MAKQASLQVQILKILNSDTRGLTIGELSKLTKSSRITVSRALAGLEGANKITVRKIGNCCLHYLKYD